MLRWGLVLAAGLAGCASALQPAPYEWVQREGNLSRRVELLEAADAHAPVIRVERDGDIYHVTDLLLDKTIEWFVPFDDPTPRVLRFQDTELSCQAGLIRHAGNTVDVKSGHSAVIHKDGALTKGQ